MSARKIDLETWPRRQHFTFFEAMEYPYMGLTSPIDVCGVKDGFKAKGVGLFAGMVHAVVGAVNDVPALRLRIRFDDSGKPYPVEHDHIDAGFTVAGPNGLFNYASCPWVDDLAVFNADVKEVSERLRHITQLETTETTHDGQVFLSCIPWLDFTHVTHPMAKNKGDSVPRISWGKFVEQDGRTHCAINIQAHHALVDGVHIAKFFEALTTRLMTHSTKD